MVDMKKIKARFGTSGNIKLGKTVGTWSVLDCYVRKSYLRYTARDTGKCSVKLGHARNTIALRENLEKCFEDLNNQMNRKRKKFELIRLNQSGEIENRDQMEMFCKLAMMHPETEFYIYTKNFDVVIPCLLDGIVPKNFTILFSIWHNYGIAEYLLCARFENVKAFVYVDSNKDTENGWSIADYREKGIEIQTMCSAYDIHGKMNHDITCDKCKKCYNRKENHKIIGCFAH